MAQSISVSARAKSLWNNLTRPGDDTVTTHHADQIALILRIGIGLVFVTGGWWKLSRALDPARADALVSKYLAPNGYINAFFQEYLFADGLLTPWVFLTALSAFELLAGIALLLGLFVRPLAIIFGVLMWSFVAALPVVTTPGTALDNATFLTPALIVQIRDVGLSGLCFVLAIVGSGGIGIDAQMLGRGAPMKAASWAAPDVLLRFSVAVVFLAGGAFYGLDHVKSWSNIPILLIVIGAVLVSGHWVRIAAMMAVIVLVFYSLGKLNIDESFLDNMNAIKREFAFLAASLVLVRFSGGRAFQIGIILRNPGATLFGTRRDAVES